MKLQVNNYGFEAELPEATNKFSIETSAKMFDILSSGIYKDKITAVIRELSCNAHDAHVAAGKAGVPFKVTLPSHLDPTFAVEDEGTGIDPERISDIYWTYGRSSKTETNDQIGALGLGSKSPFAYTKSSFIVKNRFNKREYTYLCFIDKSGVPAGTLMEEQPTDLPSGVRVELAVLANDIPTFHDRFTRFFTFWDESKRPLVSGAKVYFTPGDVALSGTGWKLLKNYHVYGCVALMGGVPYPIDARALPKLPKHLNYIPSSKFVINFDMGELNFAASREELQYDEFTVKTLVERFEEIHAEFTKYLNDKVFDQKLTPFEFVVSFSNVVQQVQSLVNSADIYAVFGKDVTFKGHTWTVSALRNRTFETSCSFTSPPPVGIWELESRGNSGVRKQVRTFIECLLDDDKNEEEGAEVAREIKWRVPNPKKPGTYEKAKGYDVSFKLHLSEHVRVVINDLERNGTKYLGYVSLSTARNLYVDTILSVDDTIEWIKKHVPVLDGAKVAKLSDVLVNLPKGGVREQRERGTIKLTVAPLVVDTSKKPIVLEDLYSYKGLDSVTILNSKAAVSNISMATFNASRGREEVFKLSDLKKGPVYYVVKFMSRKNFYDEPYEYQRYNRPTDLLDRTFVTTAVRAGALKCKELYLLTNNQVKELKKRGVKLISLKEHVVTELTEVLKDPLVQKYWETIDTTDQSRERLASLFRAWTNKSLKISGTELDKKLTSLAALDGRSVPALALKLDLLMRLQLTSLNKVFKKPVSELGSLLSTRYPIIKVIMGNPLALMSNDEEAETLAELSKYAVEKG